MSDRADFIILQFCVFRCDAARCVARVCRALLGADSMKQKKMDCGNELVILGLLVKADC